MWRESCLGLILVLAGAAAAGQDRPLFSAESALVVLHVNVKDGKNVGKGGDVGGLTRDAFEVFEDGVRQAISFFTTEDSPVTVGLLIDSSGSMQPNRAR
jgi:Ca-activated chloride channel family protein